MYRDGAFFWSCSISAKKQRNMLKVTTPRPPLDLCLAISFWTRRPERGFSPHGALFRWVHSRSWLAVVSRGKLSRVRKRTHHSDRAGTVHAANIICPLIFNLQFFQALKYWEESVNNVCTNIYIHLSKSNLFFLKSYLDNILD